MAAGEKETNGNYEAAHLYDIDGDGRAHEILAATLKTESFEVARLPSGKQGLVKHVVSQRQVELRRRSGRRERRRPTRCAET